MAPEQKKSKNRPGWAWKQGWRDLGRWQHCLRRFNSGNTASYPDTHSSVQESHFSCRYSQEAWCSAGSNNNTLFGAERVNLTSNGKIAAITVLW